MQGRGAQGVTERERNKGRNETIANMQHTRHPEYQYLDILQDLLDHGDKRMDRTGVGTLALFGRHMRYDVSDTFPVLTTRRIYWRTAIKEMLWMLSGDTLTWIANRFGRLEPALTD